MYDDTKKYGIAFLKDSRNSFCDWKNREELEDNCNIFDLMELGCTVLSREMLPSGLPDYILKNAVKFEIKGATESDYDYVILKSFDFEKLATGAGIDRPANGDEIFAYIYAVFCYCIPPFRYKIDCMEETPLSAKDLIFNYYCKAGLPDGWAMYGMR